MKEGHVCFFVDVAPEVVRREKEKARVLRKTQWWQRQTAKGLCHYCREQYPPKELTMDHITPLIRGGKSTRGNVVPACKRCNNKKKYLLPIEWEEYIGAISGCSPSMEPPTVHETEEQNHE